MQKLLKDVLHQLKKKKPQWPTQCKNNKGEQFLRMFVNQKYIRKSKKKRKEEEAEKKEEKLYIKYVRQTDMQTVVVREKV
jgi:hypothetical protein